MSVLALMGRVYQFPSPMRKRKDVIKKLQLSNHPPIIQPYSHNLVGTSNLFGAKDPNDLFIVSPAEQARKAVCYTERQRGKFAVEAESRFLRYSHITTRHLNGVQQSRLS